MACNAQTWSTNASKFYTIRGVLLSKLDKCMHEIHVVGKVFDTIELGYCPSLAMKMKGVVGLT